jgi:hypothetical protein
MGREVADGAADGGLGSLGRRQPRLFSSEQSSWWVGEMGRETEDEW